MVLSQPQGENSTWAQSSGWIRCDPIWKRRSREETHVSFEGYWSSGEQRVLFALEGTVWMMRALSVLGDISVRSQRWGVCKQTHGQPGCVHVCPCVWEGQETSRWGAQGRGAHPDSDWVWEQAVLFSHCQLARCYLLTFKRRQWQSQWLTHSVMPHRWGNPILCSNSLQYIIQLHDIRGHYQIYMNYLKCSLCDVK